MELPTLTKRIAKAPAAPGVYLWRDAKRHLLYIGKAAHLKNRLLSYLRTKDERIRLMLRNAATLTWRTTPTDTEALILESRLIKALRPRYNIEWRDDKQYLSVAVTDEPFPQFVLVHRHRSSRMKKPVRQFIGPFTDAGLLKTTLRVLRRLFPYCSCPQKHHVKCLNAHIGMCPGYCCLRQPSSKVQGTRYKKNIRAITDILTGKRDTVIRRLEHQMKTLAKHHQLEGALHLQRTIERIRRVYEHAHITASRSRTAARHFGALDQLVHELGLGRPPKRIEGYDIANIQGEHAAGSMAVFTDGRADTQEYRLFTIRTAGGDTAMLAEVISRRLNHPEWPLPDLVLVDGAKAQLNAARAAVSFQLLASRKRQKLKANSYKLKAIPIIALAKNDRHQADHLLSSLDGQVRPLVRMPRAMRDLLVHIDAEAHRFAIRHYRRRHGRALVE